MFKTLAYMFYSAGNYITTAFKRQKENGLLLHKQGGPGLIPTIIMMIIWLIAAASWTICVLFYIIWDISIIKTFFPFLLNINWLAIAIISTLFNVMFFIACYKRENLFHNFSRFFKTYEELNDKSDAYFLNRELKDLIYQIPIFTFIDKIDDLPMSSPTTTSVLMNQKNLLLTYMSLNKMQPVCIDVPNKTNGTEYKQWHEQFKIDHDHLLNLYQLWKSVFSRDFSWRISYTMDNNSKLFEIGKMVGLDSMIDAYIMDVPIDDIIQ